MPSTNFAAVNFYYHLSELDRLMTAWGFSPITTLVASTDPRTYVTALQNADVANTSPDSFPGGGTTRVPLESIWRVLPERAKSPQA